MFVLCPKSMMRFPFFFLVCSVLFKSLIPPTIRAFLVALKVKKSACNAGALGSITRSGRSPGEGNGYPLEYFYLENSMDREAWWATVHEVSKS